MRSSNKFYLCFAGMMLASCSTKPIHPSDQHILRPDSQTEPKGNIPQPIKESVILPPPKPAGKVATYSVVVTNVPAQEILFALARDAKINLDIQSGIEGAVTVNAINQTLPEILDRISRQVDMRYEINSGTLTVMPDTPFLKEYKIDYMNMSRDAEGGITNTSQVGSGTSGGAAGGTSGGAGANSSQLSIKNTSKNHFWDTLVQNIKDILHETDKILPAGSSETVVQQSKAASTTGTGAQATSGGKKSSKLPGIENSPNPASLEEGGTTVTRTSTFREAAAVIANPESGIIEVRATGKQHEKIQQFIDQVMNSARRQVMIEVTVAEVALNKNYQQGITWEKLLATGATHGFTFSQGGTGNPLPPATPTSGLFALTYKNPITSTIGNVTANVQLLESFGDVKVLSSPTLSVMNNQTAMLRVVDNLVYFTIESSVSQAANTTTLTTYTTTPHSVPVGLTMTITPEISDSNTVQVNVRPSITSQLAPVQDPNPTLYAPCGPGVPVANCPPIVSSIPQIRTREMESVLKIENNQTAVLGGLMQDSVNNLTDSVPLLANIPLIGELFKNRNDTTTKTELVIFLRPTVVHNASIDEDFSQFRNRLPDKDFFKESAGFKP
jgi:MSHA biogenesis protein MshL